MLTSTSDSTKSTISFLIRPNCSLTSPGLLLFYGAVATLGLLVAVRFYVIGAWMVLPMTLLELGFLGTVVVLLARSQRRLETISVREGELKVVRRDAKRSDEWSFPYYWARVVLQRSANHWYPSRLIIRSHGQDVEIGHCLTEGERLQLAQELRDALRGQHRYMAEKSNQH